MTTIGTFRRDGEGFVGRVSTLQLDTTVRISPTQKVSARAPEFRIFAGEAECGAAWRPSEAAAGVLLNIKLDDPTWAEPIDARLMAGEETFPLVWYRRTDDRSRHEDKPRDESRPPPG